MSAHTKTVHLVRHGQGLHNLEPESENAWRHDPSLTDLGHERSALFAKGFPFHDQIDLLCASPMRRTIQTASIAFRPLLERGMNIVAVPQAQEGFADPASTGSEVEALKDEFKGLAVDFDLVEAGWQVHEGANAVDAASLKKRAIFLRNWLSERPEKNIVLVGHGKPHRFTLTEGFFTHFMTGEVDADGNQTGELLLMLMKDRNWENLEWRAYSLSSGPDAQLVELPESKQRRDA